MIRLSTKRNICSTIFKTIQDLTTGKTKITSSGLFNGIFKGDFFKAQPIVSESDIAAIENYNNLLANNKPQEAFEQAMENASQTAQNLAKSAKGAAVDINAIPKASKAAAVGMKALSVAGSMLVSMGIAFAITKLIEGIQWLATSSERAKEAAAELADELSTQKDTIEGNISTIKGMEGEFKRLSKGVDDYGANISLSADEYERYQQIVKQIVGISPSLISGYDKEGNAIANKNGLIEQSIALLKEENRQRIANATSEETVGTLGKGKVQELKDFMNDNPLPYGDAKYKFIQAFRQATENYSIRNDKENKGNYDIFKTFGFDGYNWNDYSGASHDSVYAGNFAQDYYEQIVEDIRNGGEKARQVFTAEEIRTLAEFAKSYDNNVALYDKRMEQHQKSLNPTLQMVPQSLTVYDELTDKQKAFVSEYVNTFKIAANTTEADIKKMRQDILDFTEAIGNASPETKQAIENLFSLDKTKIPAAEWEKQVNDLINQIVNSLTFDSDEDKNKFVKNLKIRLGIEFTTDGETTVNTLISNVKKKFKGKFENEIGQLSIDDLKFLSNLDKPLEGIENWAEVETFIANAKKAADKLTVSLSESADKIKELNSILKELNGDGLSSDSIEKIISKYPELIGYIGDEAALRIELKKKIAEEENKYKQALRNKVMASSSFAEVVESKNQALFKELGLAYNKDTQKFELESRRKAAAAIKDATTAANAWAQIYADEQVLTAPDYDKDLHDAGKNSKYRDKDGNWYFEAYNDGNLTTWKYEAGSSMAKILDSQRELSNINTFNIDFDDGKSSDSGKKNEALDNYLKDAENLYKIHQDETQYINDLQWAQNNLVKSKEEELEVIGKINQAYRDLADNRIKDIQHEIDLDKERYGDDYDDTAQQEEIKRIAHEEADRYREYARKELGYYDEGVTDEQRAKIDATIEKTDEIQGLQKTWWDAENTILDNAKTRHENAIRDIEHERDMALAKDEDADVTSYYKRLQDEYHKEAERLRALDPEKYKEDIQELMELWWDAENSIVDWEWENSNNWINDRNTYNDWVLFNDSEIDAWERVIERLSKDYLNNIDKIKEAEKSLFEARKKEFDKGVNFGNTYFESQKTLLQAHYDVENSIAEARHEINKELETSMTMYGYLDEETRKLLFNQEDYYELSQKLNEIEDESLRLQSDYEDKLRHATLETVESITSEYKMQYETLMKSYEIAKADLEIAKKKQKLNNVLNERNVRMFINGSWQWVANTEDVINAKSELADAEYAKQVEEAGLTQKESIDNLTRQQDELGVVVKKFENGVIDLNEAIRLAEEAIGGMPSALASIFNKAKGSVSSSSSSASKGGNSGGGANSSYVSWAKAQMEENSKNWHTADENGKKALEAANQSLGAAIGSTYDKDSGTWEHKYATGTKYTKSGLALMGEDSEEFYIPSNGRLIPINQPTIGNIAGGGVVFNAEQMKSVRAIWDMSNLNLSGGAHLVGGVRPQQIDQSQDNRIIINGMTVDSGSADGQALISALKRYVGNH